ncbi:MAG: ribonuclease III [Nitrospirota bacterium]
MLASSLKNLHKLEIPLGYTFKNKAILLEALTHSSFYHENPNKVTDYNERLEFLGDSILGFVIVEYLFSLESQFKESIMAKIKSYLVKESVLSDIASSISLGKHLRLGKGEEASGGRTKKSLLADALEALLGAIYIDGGYKKVKDIILRLFGEKIDSILSSGEFYDFKTELQEEAQLLFGVLPEYRTIKQEGEEHRKIFTVEVFIDGRKYGTGSGRSKKEAQTFAAKEALHKLRNKNR